MLARARNTVCHLVAAVAFSGGAVGCGSSSNADDPMPDASTVDAPSDTSPRDAVRDAPRDTAVEHVPKAPRCAPSSEGDAGVDAGAPTDGADAGAFDANVDADADADAELDATSEAGLDAGDAAPVPYRPVQVVDSGGRVLRAPRVVPITYDTDPNRLDIEDFVASVGCTPYWRAVSAEYGVGDLVSGTPIHLAEAPPASISDSGIERWLRTQLQAKAPGWEAPTPDTIYAVYYPSTTNVRLGSSNGCDRFDGFHKSFLLADGTTVVYAVMIDCGDDVDRLTSVTSHELIEASTDPEPIAAPAHLHADDAHAVYGLRTGSEVGDLCENDIRAYFFPSGYPFMVQRSWSNLAALAKRDPCVPAQAGPYFNTAPELLDEIGTYYAATVTVGVRIPIGESRTIMVQLYSDGPVEPWNLSAHDESGEPPHLTFSFDKTTGNDGDRIALTISKKSESSSLGAEPFSIVSSNGFGRRTVAYGLVGH